MMLLKLHVCLRCYDFSVFFFFKQKTAYEMRISDWSSDVCSSDLPDPGIKYVLRGWPYEGKPARYNLQVGDMHVRNVPTNIRGYGDVTEYDGNSIFIFDVAGLCLAHLGHLHPKLTPGHIPDICPIPVLFLPVAGGSPLNISPMTEGL